MAETQTQQQPERGTEEPATQAAEHHDEHSHPGVKEYVEIGAILAILTAMEVAFYYLPIPRPVAVPGLIALTIMKFVLVVLWFMHLRFDSPWFRRLFATGFVAAAILYLITVVLSL